MIFLEKEIINLDESARVLVYRFKNKFRILTTDKKEVFDSRSVIFGNDEFSKI